MPPRASVFLARAFFFTQTGVAPAAVVAKASLVCAVLLNGVYTDLGWRNDADKAAAAEYTERDFEQVRFY